MCQQYFNLKKCLKKRSYRWKPMKDIKKTSIKMSHYTIRSTFKHSQNKKAQ